MNEELFYNVAYIRGSKEKLIAFFEGALSQLEDDVDVMVYADHKTQSGFEVTVTDKDCIDLKCGGEFILGSVQGEYDDTIDSVDDLIEEIFIQKKNDGKSE